MYHGKPTEELEKLFTEYESVFGYNPNEENELDFGPDEKIYYADVLRRCIKKKQDIYEVLGIEDD